MKRKIIQLVGIMTAALVLLAPSSAMAASVIGDACRNRPNSVVCKQSRNAETKTNQFIRNVTNLLLFVLGTIAVIMIIVGGIRYATSNGDQNQITAAKNTVLYAVIGLVVALMAWAIVNFVIGAFF